eukprot:gene8198-16857_t
MSSMEKSKKKSLKKAMKGQITTFSQYEQCILSGIHAKSDILFLHDKTRINCRHDVNITELRDLLISIFIDKPPPKFFEVKNRPFIRHVVIIHLSECDDPNALQGLSPMLFSSFPILTTRVSCGSNATNQYTPLTKKLLTIDSDETDNNNTINTNSNNNTNINSNNTISTASRLSSLSEASRLLAHLPRMQCVQSYDIDNNSNNDVNDNNDNNNGEVEVEEPGENGFIQTLSCHSEEWKLLGGGEYYNNKNDNNDYNKNVKKKNYNDEDGNSNNNTTSTNAANDDATNVDDELLPMNMVAIDCEMCDTSQGLELTRISLVNANGVVLLDTLVLPDSPITDYRTQWSGISASTMKGVNIRLLQVQLELLRIIKSDTLLIVNSALVWNGADKTRLMRMCTGGTANAISCTSNEAVIKKSIQFINNNNNNNNKHGLNSSSNNIRKQSLLYLNLHYEELYKIDKSPLLSSIDNIKQALQNLEEEAIIIITNQMSLRNIDKLMKQRRVCSTSLCASTWSVEQENELKKLLVEANYGQMCFTMIHKSELK